MDEIDIKVLPCNWVAFEIFGSLRHSWNYLSVGMTRTATGLNMNAIWELIKQHPESPADRTGQWALFKKIQFCEVAALIEQSNDRANL